MITKLIQNLYTKQARNFSFSFCLAFLFSFCLVTTAKAEGASLFISPASGTFEVGDTFRVKVNVDTAGIAINAAQFTIDFPPEQLEILKIAKDNSIFTIWPREPDFSNKEGEISLAGGVPHPGFEEVGNIIALDFKAKESGAVNLYLAEGRVLADDGRGTDVLVFIKEAKYLIKERISFPALEEKLQVFSKTHPNQEEWYNNNSPHFQWLLPELAAEASFVLDRHSQTWPDTIAEGEISETTYQNLEDGVWYFHLRLKRETGWSDPAHYQVRVDISPPSLFEVTLDNKGDATNPKPDIYFETQDDVSGISHYKLKIDEGSFLDLMLAQISPFPLSFQKPGEHSIAVRAVDRAGNNTESKTILEIKPIATPEVFIWPRYHTSGEEIFYLEGKTLSATAITIFLKKDGEIIKKWQTFSDSKGGWAFATDELLKSGIYYLSVQAQDARGAFSLESESREVVVRLSGVALGNILISYKTLLLALLSIFILAMMNGIFLIFRTRYTKKILRQEVREAQDEVETAFNDLEKMIEKKIEMLDSRPGFSEREKQICRDLKETLNISKESISKEIEDVRQVLQ